MNRKFLYIITGIIVIGGAAYIGLKPDEQISATGAPLADVSVPQLTPAQSAGEVAFNKNCAACHGQNAAGQDGVAPPLVHPIYEPSHHGDQAFVMAAQRGFIDEVIMPHSTRRRVARAFEILKGKKVTGPAKKHDNIPL